MPTRKQNEDILQDMQAQLNTLTKQVAAIRNSQTPTVPIYSSEGFPSDAIEGQIAIAEGSSDGSGGGLRVIHREASDLQIDNPTSDTAYMTVVVPANALYLNKMLHVKVIAETGFGFGAPPVTFTYNVWSPALNTGWAAGPIDSETEGAHTAATLLEFYMGDRTALPIDPFGESQFTMFRLTNSKEWVSAPGTSHVYNTA